MANEETNDSDQPLWSFAVEAKASCVANPRFYFSTTRFREIFPDALCGGGPLHVARPLI
jgi:hypothetical protein